MNLGQSVSARTRSRSTLNAVTQGLIIFFWNVLFSWKCFAKTPTVCRNHHVYQLSVQPTWKTAVVRKRLKGSLKSFQIDLMDGPFINLCVFL